MLSIIVAAATNGAIGKNNQLLWHLRNDMRHFKATTMGHPVIMGRKTWESLGRPLPGRRNIVVSRTEQNFQGAEWAKSLPDAFAKCGDENAFIIGGGEIYNEALPFAQRVHLTRVDCCPDADTFFGELSASQWVLRQTQQFEADEQNDHAHTIQLWERKE